MNLLQLDHIEIYQTYIWIKWATPSPIRGLVMSNDLFNETWCVFLSDH
jgi:hypothetical protein